MSIVEKSLSKIREARAEKFAAPAADAAPTVSPVEFGKTYPRDGSAGRFIDSLGPRVLPIDSNTLRASGLLPPTESAGVLEEQLRRIKSPLLECATGRKAAEHARGRLIMVTSSLPNEGKTFVSANLAFSLARDKDLTVLLVDGDVRKADISTALGVEREPGLADLAGDASLTLKDVVIRSSVPQLCILPAGRMADDLPELWASARMDGLMQYLATLDGRTVVLFDSSPVLLTNETHVLSQLVGQVLFVVRADTTHRKEVTEALDLIDSSPKVSCVLNQTSEAQGEYYYGRYPYGGRQEKKTHREGSP